MEDVNLSFGVIKYLSDQICEVIVNEGVEMNDAMVDEYHAYLGDRFKSSFALLINKKNNYTYTFSAQQRLASLPNIKAMAAVVYRHSTEIATHALQSIKRDHDWNMKIFYDRLEAIDWLESQLALEMA